jgi:hypothetical protein
MEKRSRRRIRDLVTQLASQGLSENENGRARISMMAKSNERSTHGPDTEAQDQSSPSLTSGLQHTAGPYKRVKRTKSEVRVRSAYLGMFLYPQYQLR